MIAPHAIAPPPSTRPVRSGEGAHPKHGRSERASSDFGHLAVRGRLTADEMLERQQLAGKVWKDIEHL